VGINAQKCLTQSDEAGNVQQRIWCELVQLHTIHKQEPTKKFVGRERESAEEEGQKHHPVSHRRCRDDLGAREDDIGRFCQKPSLFIFVRFASTKEELAQPMACFFVPFFAILLQCATRLKIMQWRGARSCEQEQAQGRRSVGIGEAENW
jgi:hypothetical protein